MIWCSSVARFCAAVTFGSTFCHSRFGGVQLALDLNRPVGVPAVVEEEERSEAAQGNDAQLEWIAFALALLGDFLVEKIKLQSHR